VDNQLHGKGRYIDCANSYDDGIDGIDEGEFVKGKLVTPRRDYLDLLEDDNYK
jgi:hypothetical protein